MTGMNELPSKLPAGLTLEKIPAFVPRMVMTDELQTVMREVLRQWKHRDRFAGLVKFGIRPLDRLLFFGPPGNGKTMASQWMCQELKTPLYRVRCEQLIGMLMGDMVRGLTEVTDYLRTVRTPAVCLFDEIESIFIDRSASAGQCDRERATALTAFFQALDRWETPTLIVMCTNLVDQLDPALLSRIELKLEFQGPTADQAREVVEYWRELLCEHGADDWGPGFAESIEAGCVPESFRDLTQRIGRAARDWTATAIKDEG